MQKKPAANLVRHSYKAGLYSLIDVKLFMKKLTLFLLWMLVSGLIFAAAPTSPSYNLNFSGVEGNSLSFSFNNGNGQGRIVVLKEGSSVSSLPVNGVSYNADGNFGKPGTEFTEAGAYVVYKGTGNSITVTNLRASTIYYLSIFEYNGSGAATEYLMTALNGTKATLSAPTKYTTAFNASAITGNSVKLTWTPGDGTNQLIVARKGTVMTAEPVDLTNYFAFSSFGNGAVFNGDHYVVFKGNATSATVTNLEPNTSYTFSIYELNGVLGPLFLRPGTTTVAQTTQGPTIPASNLSFSNIEGNQLSLGFSIGNGSKRLVVARKGSPVSALPVNGTNYTANASFGSGSEIATGEYVVSNSNSNNIVVNHLEAGTAYYFAVFEYDVDKAGTAYYLTSSFLSGSRMTAITPVTQASNVTFSNISGTGATINYTPGSGTYRLILMKEGAPVDAEPADFSFYSGNSNFGSGTQIGNKNYVVSGGATSNLVNVTGLKPGFTYYAAVFEFNGSSYPVYNRPGATAVLTLPSEPSSPAVSFSAQNVDGGSLRPLWTSGNGGRRIVIASKDGPVQATPQDGTNYTANSVMGQGTALGSGEYVVYDGTSNYFDLTGLIAGTTYYFAVYEYNQTPSGPDYLTTKRLIGTAATLGYPTVQTAMTINAAGIQTNNATISYTGGNGGGRLFVMKQGAPVDQNPADFIVYSYSNVFNTTLLGNGNYIVHKATGTSGSFTVSNLQPNTTYYIAAYEYNGSNSPVYLVPGSTGSFTTKDVAGAVTPTTAASQASFSGIDGNQLQLGWTNGDGAYRIVVARKDQGVTFIPANSTSYTANASFGAGTDLGGQQFVVYNGTGDHVTVTQLLPGTQYYFTVYEYTGAGTLIRYLTSSALSASHFTATTPLKASESFTSVSFDTELDLSWTSGDGNGRLVVVREGSPVSAQPSDLTSYPSNLNFGSGIQLAPGEFALYSGNASHIRVTGLTTNKTYFFKIFEWNGIAAPVYNRTVALSGSATTGSTLPLRWIAFTGSVQGRNAVLDWITAEEVGVSHFGVERSQDGQHFQEIASVPVLEQKQHAYHFVDPQPAIGKTYYRISEYENDRRKSFSSVVMIKGNEAEPVQLIVNRDQKSCVVYLNNDLHQATLNIFNAQGQAIKQGRVENGKSIALPEVKGVCFFVLVVDGVRYTRKVIF